MKVLFTMKPPTSSNGGGCFFVKYMVDYLKAHNIDITYQLENDIDIIMLMDPRKNRTNLYDIDTIINFKKAHPHVKIIHRINECDAKRFKSINLEPLLMYTAINSDYIVFISNWLKNYFCNKYPFESSGKMTFAHFSNRIQKDKNTNFANKLNKAFVINNGCDLQTYYPLSNKISNKIKLVTHHWSDNYNKGFYIYNKIDKLLDQCKLFEFTYIGRYNRDYTPKNIRLIKPMFGKELGEELRKHHIYVTASLNEPCGMHQLEGMASGLPVLFRNGSGGIEETIFGCGEMFKDIDDFLLKLVKIMENYQQYKSKINFDFINANRMAEQYYNVLNNIT